MKERRHPTSARWGQFGSAALFLSPNLIGFLIFLAGPLIVSFLMAFTNWDLRRTVAFEFVGLRNFLDLVRDERFWNYLINTFYLMLGIPFSIAGSLVLALLLSKPIQSETWLGRFVHAALALLVSLVIAAAVRSIGTQAGSIAGGLVLLAGVFYAMGALAGVVVFRTVYYLPSFTSGVALYILWKTLYNPQYGPINGALWWMLDGPWGGLNATLARVGMSPLSPPEWLQSLRNLLSLDAERPGFAHGYFGIGAREAIVLMGIVTGVGGGNMLLYLAALSNVPQDLYEAADIDGASRWQRFWAVTWPQLAPTTFFIIVMSCIGGLQGGFDVARVMTNGGPSGTTTTLAFYIYDKAFLQFRLGFASAAAWALFLVVLVVTLVNWRFGNRELND
jgi:multiple sugar transport system permease protein